LLEFEAGAVRIRYKDYAHGNRNRVLKLSAVEFGRRLMLHVLPAGFVRIRHYGILAHRHRHEKLALCGELLGSGAPAEPESLEPVPQRDSPSSITPTRVCPICGAGRMIVIEEWPPRSRSAPAQGVTWAWSWTVRNLLRNKRSGWGVPKRPSGLAGAGNPRAEAGKPGERGRAGRPWSDPPTRSGAATGVPGGWAGPDEVPEPSGVSRPGDGKTKG
jgi:hypothetical protein